MCVCVRSVCLLLQVALPCALFADASSQLSLKGGTNAEMAPQIDYTVKVCPPTMDPSPGAGTVSVDCQVSS